jgi:S-adenosylmethionine:tRNA ribosyltransferase-isomerase
LQVSDFDYELPEALIAQEPLAKRDHSRLLVVDKKAETFQHTLFTQIGTWLSPGDLLVFNDTKVIPARLWGRRLPGGGRIEVLLLSPRSADQWEVLVRPGRKVPIGQMLAFGTDGELTARAEERTAFGGRTLRFSRQGADLRSAIMKLGEVPLPPYIKTPLPDYDRYQTVYARAEGSAAAPTAGLHFTPELLWQLSAAGIKTAYLTLHVGLGTFRPVKTETVEAHQMHTEYFQISTELAAAIAATKASGQRVIAVGTTSVRALETMGRADGTVQAGEGQTAFFIYPGYQFKVLDGLITNFHLPRSTLLMLVSAFAGRELTLAAYEEAIKERYRFFSFGDAMLLL